MKIRRVFIVLGFAVLALQVPLTSQTYPQKEIVAKNGLVVACDARAADAGLAVLKRGGNAVDAAVTTAFLMGVYEPYNNGIGGHGGQMGLYWAKTGEFLGIDSSSRAPAAARPDMFEVVGQPPGGNPGDVWRVKVKDEANAIGFRAMFAPSTVAGYWHLIEEYGTLPWKEVLAPAVKVAEEGFIADAQYVNAVKNSADRLRRFPGSSEMYLPNGQVPNVGDRIVFRDMAKTLRLIAEGGYDAYYKGEIADRIVDYIQKNGGILTKEDFASYEVEVNPLTATQYRGDTILSYPQGSNGSALGEVLNILSNFDLRAMGFDTAESTHVFIEAMKLAFIDRYQYVGDRDFEPVPFDGLMAWGYGRERARLIRMDQAQVFQPGDPWKYEASGRRIFDRLGGTSKPKTNSQAPAAAQIGRQEDTTFLTVADRDGNVILITSSNQSAFGSKVTVPGLGITLNNTMNNMNPNPGHPLSIAPFKRALRNSGVCIVVRDNKPFLVVSAPGGRQIISATLRTLTNVLDYGLGIQAAIDAPRIHAEANLYEVQMESRVPEDVRRRLTAMGHRINVTEEYSGGFATIQGIIMDSKSGLRFGGSDPRTHGGARGY
jgi:gamma-glutamyltranspeptidase/glutathione hydrolase